MLPRCGRVAHICEANCICNKFFLLQLHVLKLSNSDKVVSWASRLQVQTRQRGNCSTLAGKSRGGTPFCRMRKTVFSKRNSPRNTTWIQFGKAGAHPQLAWESQLPLKPCILLQPSALKGNCDSSNFFLDFCFVSLYSFICFANVGCSPTPRQHFWKTAAPKNFSLPAARFLKRCS